MKKIILALILSMTCVIIGVFWYQSHTIETDYHNPVKFTKREYKKRQQPYSYVTKASYKWEGDYYKFWITEEGVLKGNKLNMHGYPYQNYKGENQYIDIASNVKHLYIGYSDNPLSLIFLTNDGKLYGYGWQYNGSFGVKVAKEYEGSIYHEMFREPVLITDHVKYAEKTRASSVLILKEDNSVYSIGLQYKAKTTWYQNEDAPVISHVVSYKLIKIFDRAKRIKAYEDNLALITEDNDLYIWGNNVYGQLGNGKRGGEYYTIDIEQEEKPQKIMSDVADVSIKKGRIEVTRLDGSEWAAGLGAGNEKADDGKKISTKFVLTE